MMKLLQCYTSTLRKLHEIYTQNIKKLLLVCIEINLRRRYHHSSNNLASPVLELFRIGETNLLKHQEIEKRANKKLVLYLLKLEEMSNHF